MPHRFTLELLEDRSVPAAPVGPEFSISSYSTDQQANPSVAMDADGDFVVVWNRLDQQFNNQGIFAQRYNASGAPQGNEFRVDSPEVQGSLPSVAMDADGDFVVVWSNSEVYAKRFNAAGEAQGSEILVNNFTTGPQFLASVAMDADGDFIVAWYGDGPSGNNNIHARRFTAAGAPRANQFQVDTVVPSGGAPSVAMSASGAFVVTWTSTGLTGQDGSLSGIYARRYNSSGVAQGVEFRVNTFTTNTQTSSSVAMDADGDFVVTWFGFGLNDPSIGIFAKRYSANGVAQGNEFRVNTAVAGFQQLPSVAMNAGGDFVVTWDSRTQDGDQLGISAQQYDAAGAPVGGEFRVNDFTTGVQRNAKAAIDADGDFVIAWESGTYESGIDILAQRFSSDVVASIPSLSVVQPTTADQGTSIPLSIAVQSNDTAKPSETISVRIQGTPVGTVFSAGMVDSLGRIMLTEAQLSGLTVTFPADFVGTPTLTIFAWSTESSTGAVSAEVSRLLNFTIVDAVASAPLLFRYPAQGEQDAFIPLTVFAALTDADSETLSIRISNVPAGATLSAGTADGPGAFLLTPAQLFGLTIQPPFVFAGTITLNVEARSTEMNGGDVATIMEELVVTVSDHVATPPSLTVQPASGNQDSAILLSIIAALVDADGSEALTLRISGLPAGATRSTGTPDGAG
ncbi:MAG: hypothetical protein ACRDD1_14140, partial [Planctomycetia bacterium]